VNYHNFTPEELAAFKLLRDNGFAVCAFTPEELGGASHNNVEGSMTSAGWDAIECEVGLDHLEDD
jgi:hypothetical protein